MRSRAAWQGADDKKQIVEQDDKEGLRVEKH